MNRLSIEIRTEINMVIMAVATIRHDYIPARDTDFHDFQEGFIVVLIAKGPGWGVPGGVITDLTNKQSEWVGIWNVAKHKTTRTQTQVEQKDTIRGQYEKMLRSCIQQWVYDNPLVPEADIVECGLPPHDKTRTPSTLPEDAPELTLKPRDGNRLFIKFTLPAEGDGSTLKGMPKGVKLIEIVWDFVMTEGGPDACKFHDVAVKSSAEVQFENADQGRKVAIFARYVSTTGEKGPWSEIRWTIVP